MKIDYEIIKGILTVFEESDNLTSDVDDIKESLKEADPKEIFFNLQMLNDKGVVIKANGDPGIGIILHARKEDYSYEAVQLRITAQGMDFLEALKKPAIWEKIKAKLSDAALGTVIEFSKKALIEGLQNLA